MSSRVNQNIYSNAKNDVFLPIKIFTYCTVFSVYVGSVFQLVFEIKPSISVLLVMIHISFEYALLVY